jgi:hypothetical protein
MRELKVSRNTVRKVLRSGAISFEYTRAPDPANRLHNQHPPPPARHPKRGSLPTTANRGSKLDADHPSTGVNIPRRITCWGSGWQLRPTPLAD